MKKLIILMLLTLPASAIFAQKSKQYVKSKTTPVQVAYTCPMHPEVISATEGKCPKCSKSLVLSKKEEMKMEAMKYTCPTHRDVASDKAGKCPICGMTLEKKKSKTTNFKAKT